MARSTSKTAARKAPGRKTGRPSNASIAERNQSAQRNLIEMVSAAASAAARGALEGALAGGVVTIGTPGQSQNQNQNSGSGTGDGQSASNSGGTSRRGGSTSTSSATNGTKRPPGRRADPNSKLSKSREIYAANIGKMERNDIVNKMVEKLGIDKSVANTYYHTIHRGAGGTSTRRKAATKTSKAA